MQARLYKQYIESICAELMEQLKCENIHQVPRLEKIVVNMGVSPNLEKGALDMAVQDLALITGRKPSITKARMSVSNFKLRKGASIGCRVTLRREVMYEFYDRLVTAALPRLRDFRGLSQRSFDGWGNYSLGLPDQTIFPEVDLDKVKRNQGMDVTIVTTARSDEGAYALLKSMGMPFRDEN